MNHQSLQTLQQHDQLPAVQHETASQAVASKARALVEARYVMALRNPRDLDVVRERLIKDCKRPSFAKVARYNKPIGQGISGPSIRFAEAAIRCMTNINVDIVTVYDDREKRIVSVTVSDSEANTGYSQDVTIDKTVERKKPKPGDVVLRTRMNSYGESVSLIEATEDDVLNKQNALISKAVRTQGLRLIPGDLIDEAMHYVIQTQKNEDAKDPDSAKFTLFDNFAEIGIRVEQIKEFLGHDADKLTPKELTDLRGLYAAIRDGEATWNQAVEKKKPKAETPSDVKDMEEQLRKRAKDMPKPEAHYAGEGLPSGKASQTITNINAAIKSANDDLVKETLEAAAKHEDVKTEASEVATGADMFGSVE